MFQLDSDIYNKSRQVALSERLGNQQIAASQQDMGLNEEKIKQAKIERAAQYLGMATPENWQAIRSQAIGEGLGAEDTIPQQYDENWINQTRQAFDSHKKSDGGSTGVLVDRYMQSTGASFPEALQAVQTGFRQNMLLGANGRLSAILGAPEAKGQLKYGEVMGGKRAEFEMNPPIERETNRAGVVGKDLGEADNALRDAESSMPQLESAVQTLSDLGKDATYTLAGRATDTAVRQSGMGATEGAKARAAYIAHVKNNVLPLLRQTFGAQFTAAEGESLLATLGDPNASPEEKDATLKAFIEDKRATLGTLERRAGRKLSDPIAPATPAPGSTINWGDF